MEALYLYVSTLLAFFIISKHFIPKLKSLPPSPSPTLPFLGHFHLLKKPFHRSLSKLSSKYGPVLFLRLGCRPVLLVSSPSTAEECFTRNDIVFANRPKLLHGKYYGYGYTSLAWSSYGDNWRNLRRVSSIELLSSHRIQVMQEIRVDEVRSLIRRLFRASKENCDEMIDMRTELYELTFNVMTRMIIGRRYCGKDVENSREAKVFHAITMETARLSSEANILDLLPFMRWFGPFRDTEKKLKEVQERRDRFMQEIIDEQREMAKDDENGERNNNRSIINVLLDLQASEPQHYTDEAVKSLLLVLLQAGSNTSTSSLEWAFSYLLGNPQILDKAQRHIDDLVGQNRLIGESDLSEIPYIGYIINETLRIQPPVPMLMPHRSSSDCTVGGFHIPGGTMLLANIWGIQHDPRVWEDPEEFKPERFEGQELGRDGKDAFKLLPFGSGRRGCPGENLARRMLGLALGSLIQCFNWEKASDDTDMCYTGLGSATRARPLMTRCRPRPNMVNLLSGV